MINLDIGGIQLGISAYPPVLGDKLQQRYRPFVRPEEANVFEVQIRVQPDENAPRAPLPQAPPIHFDGNRAHFQSPGFRGMVDQNGGHAEVRLDSFQAENQADYFLRVCLALLAYQAGGLLVHAAGIVHQGRAFLFFGPSGSGKTTAARCSPPDAVLNDDLVLLLPAKTGWRAFGTPFSNPTQVPPRADSAPAAALLRLVQSKEVRLSPLGWGQALAELLVSAPVLNASPFPPLDRCQQILADLPVYSLYFLPDPSFWPIVAGIP